MFKLFHKKLNKKGFTLAEMLIVVAIIAILIAIAVPIFTNALRDAQWRVNQANVRSVKSAGVAKILTNWNLPEDEDDELISTGALDTNCWKVIGTVNGKGDIVDIKVTVEKATAANKGDGIALDEEGTDGLVYVDKPGFKTIAPKGDDANDPAQSFYYPVVYLTNLDLSHKS